MCVWQKKGRQRAQKPAAARTMDSFVQKAGRLSLFILLFILLRHAHYSRPHSRGGKGAKPKGKSCRRGEKEENAEKGNERKIDKTNNRKASEAHVVGPKSSGTFFFSQLLRYFLAPLWILPRFLLLGAPSASLFSCEPAVRLAVFFFRANASTRRSARRYKNRFVSGAAVRCGRLSRFWASCHHMNRAGRVWDVADEEANYQVGSLLILVIGTTHLNLTTA